MSMDDAPTMPSHTVRWRRSSHSGQGGGQCVEVANLAPAWRKSSRSGPNGGDYVEVVSLAGPVGVRDSKNPTGPALVFAAHEWAAFLYSTKSGHLDITSAEA